jgi:hypothetical protein
VIAFVSVLCFSLPTCPYCDVNLLIALFFFLYRSRKSCKLLL